FSSHLRRFWNWEKVELPSIMLISPVWNDTVATRVQPCGYLVRIEESKFLLKKPSHPSGWWRCRRRSVDLYSKVKVWRIHSVQRIIYDMHSRSGFGFFCRLTRNDNGLHIEPSAIWRVDEKIWMPR